MKKRGRLRFWVGSLVFGEEARWMGVATLARVVAAGAAVVAAVVGMPLSGAPPPPPNRLRQDSRVSDVESGGEFRIS